MLISERAHHENSNDFLDISYGTMDQRFDKVWSDTNNFSLPQKMFNLVNTDMSALLVVYFYGMKHMY